MAEVRALEVMGADLYAVVGSGFFKVTSAAGNTQVGSINSSTGICYMANNGTQILLTDGSRTYVYDGSTLAAVSDTDFPGAKTLTYQDGYFIVHPDGDDKFYVCTLYDGDSWDALDYASAEGSPDNLQRVISNHRELWCFGTETTEVWYNSGDADFPFERIQGAFIEKGCIAPASVAKLDNALFWLTNEKQIVRSEGYTPRVISTEQLEYLIQDYADPDEAVGFGYTQAGHSFYQITFPKANTVGVSWVYDARTGLWFERSSYITSGDNNQGRHRANCHAFFNNLNLVGDYANGKVYELDDDTYDDDGEAIVRERTGFLLQDVRKNVFYNSFELEFEPGVGLQSGQGSTPYAMLQWSKDGGHSWSNELWREIGEAGEYKQRAIWRRLGKSRNRVFRVRITDPVKVAIIGATLDAEEAEF